MQVRARRREPQLDGASQTIAAATDHGAHRTDRLPARYGLRDNTCPVLAAPLPPTAPWWHYAPSRPNGQNQTADSQMSTSSGSGDKTLAMKLLAGGRCSTTPCSRTLH